MTCGKCGGTLFCDKHGNVVHTKEECERTNLRGNMGCLFFIFTIGYIIFIAYSNTNW